MKQASAGNVFVILFMPPPQAFITPLSLLAHAAPDASEGNNFSRLHGCASRMRAA
jgi:hypothetical protein